MCTLLSIVPHFARTDGFESSLNNSLDRSRHKSQALDKKLIFKERRSTYDDQVLFISTVFAIKMAFDS